jgi:hypothetical protein
MPSVKQQIIEAIQKQNVMKKFIAGSATFYDNERDLFRTDIGINNSDGPLLCSVWGNTERQSRDRANSFKILLESVVPVLETN